MRMEDFPGQSANRSIGPKKSDVSEENQVLYSKSTHDFNFTTEAAAAGTHFGKSWERRFYHY